MKPNLSPINELVSSHEAEALAAAAKDMGGIAVRRVAEAGQSYIHASPPLVLERRPELLRPEKVTAAVVPPHKTYIEISGELSPDSAAELRAKAQELQIHSRPAESKAA